MTFRRMFPINEDFNVSTYIARFTREIVDRLDDALGVPSNYEDGKVVGVLMRQYDSAFFDYVDDFGGHTEIKIFPRYPGTEKSEQVNITIQASMTGTGWNGSYVNTRFGPAIYVKIPRRRNSSVIDTLKDGPGAASLTRKARDKLTEIISHELRHHWQDLNKRIRYGKHYDKGYANADIEIDANVASVPARFLSDVASSKDPKRTRARILKSPRGFFDRYFNTMIPSNVVKTTATDDTKKKYARKITRDYYRLKDMPIDEGYIENAVKEFGITNDPSEAFWILPDGRMLDGSGKNQGGDGGSRAFDHRQVRGDGTQGMRRLLAAGWIRWMPEGNGFYIRVRPTPKQIRTMQRIGRERTSDFWLEVGKHDEYQAHFSNIGKLIRAVNDFFDGKIHPDRFTYGDYTAKELHQAKEYWKKNPMPRAEMKSGWEVSYAADYGKNTGQRISPGAFLRAAELNATRRLRESVNRISKLDNQGHESFRVIPIHENPCATSRRIMQIHGRKTEPRNEKAPLEGRGMYERYYDQKRVEKAAKWIAENNPDMSQKHWAVEASIRYAAQNNITDEEKIIDPNSFLYASGVKPTQIPRGTRLLQEDRKKASQPMTLRDTVRKLSPTETAQIFKRFAPEGIQVRIDKARTTESTYVQYGYTNENGGFTTLMKVRLSNHRAPHNRALGTKRKRTIKSDDGNTFITYDLANASSSHYVEAHKMITALKRPDSFENADTGE